MISYLIDIRPLFIKLPVKVYCIYSQFVLSIYNTNLPHSAEQFIF